MSSIGKRLLPVAAAAILILATVSSAGAASAGTTSVTITTPKTGQSTSLKRNPYTAVAGSVSFSPASPTTTRFYLRRDGCGTSNDNPHLSIASGVDGGDGCGVLFNAVVGVGGDVVQTAFVDFPASDGMPLAFDASHPVSGVIALTGAQVGLAEVDVSLEALVNGEPAEIGADNGASAVLDPTGNDTPVPFSFTPNAALAGADIQALDLRVRIHGPNVYSGFVSLSGNSYADLGSHAASVNRTVQLSLDDPTFANAVPARIGGSATTWSVAIPTPAIGTHTLYARSLQGFDTSATTSTTFKVTK
jgi:hypothetical protein